LGVSPGLRRQGPWPALTAGKRGLLAGDDGLQLGNRLHEHVVGDDVNGPLGRFVEAHQPRLAFLDPQPVGDRLDRRTVVNDRFAVMHDHATAWRDPGVVPFDDLQQMAGHGQAHRHRHALIPDERSRDLCGRLDAQCGDRLALVD